MSPPTNWLNTSFNQKTLDTSLTKLEHESGDIHFIGEALPAPSLILPDSFVPTVGDSPFPARENHVHGITAHHRPIFTNNTERDAWLGTKLTGMTCIVQSPGTIFGVAGRDVEYIWNGTTWVEWTFPFTGGWPNALPTVTQSVGISYTPTNIRFKLSNGVVYYSGVCSITSAGIAGNVVKVSLPITARSGGGLPAGSGSIYDASANIAFAGMAYLDTTGLLAIQGGSGAVNNGLGASGFTAALTTPDAITWSVTYERN